MKKTEKQKLYSFTKPKILMIVSSKSKKSCKNNTKNFKKEFKKNLSELKKATDQFLALLEDFAN